MIRSIAIIGMGALGLLYADQLTSGLQNNEAVTFVMDAKRLARHKEDVYTINGTEKQFVMKAAEEMQPVDLVIVAVKYNALQDALETMKNCVDDHTIIISVMNGVVSEKILGERFGADHILDCVAQGMDAMRDGSSLVYTQCGALRIGAENALQEKNLEPVRELFEAANVPHVVEEDILYRMWFKFMLNVGINQICMCFDTNYGVATTEGTEEYGCLVAAMKEVQLVAAAQGITLTDEDLLQTIEIEKTLDPKGYPSMAQDGKAKRPSEVDMFAGTVIELGKKYGIETPTNCFLYKRVKEIESTY